LSKKPLLLIILDGLGIAPHSPGNAVSLAKTPILDSVFQKYPHATLQAAGEAVGLPWHNMGSSEVGHMNIGSGRIMYQELPLINKDIESGKFFDNKAFKKVVKHIRKNKSALHLVGILTPAGIHAHTNHLFALLELCRREKIKKVYLHLFLDGRDAPSKSGLTYLKELRQVMKEKGVGQIATLSGRFYAMDRNDRWDRTEKTYMAMVLGEGRRGSDALRAVRNSYQRKVFDEKLEPTVITRNKKPVAQIKSQDGIIFFNFRSDRAKQLTKALVLPGFDKFLRPSFLREISMVTMTKYDNGLPVEVAFDQEGVRGSLGETISQKKLKQYRIAESEKYAHVSVFFNCGRIDPFLNEERDLIPSPHVSSYDKAPEMSAKKVSSSLLAKLKTNRSDFYCLNFANPDMLGHTGMIRPTIKAIETVDLCLKKIIPQFLGKDGHVIITSDHGNSEVMIDLETGEADREHTANPVPFFLVSKKFEMKTSFPLDASRMSALAPVGVLADIAPTILDLMEIEQPDEMTGISLLKTIL